MSHALNEVWFDPLRPDNQLHTEQAMEEEVLLPVHHVPGHPSSPSIFDAELDSQYWS